MNAAKMRVDKKSKPKTRKNKPYQRADYPGQKIQMDVKYVPREWAVVPPIHSCG